MTIATDSCWDMAYRPTSRGAGKEPNCGCGYRPTCSDSRVRNRDARNILAGRSAGRAAERPHESDEVVDRVGQGRLAQADLAQRARVPVLGVVVALVPHRRDLVRRAGEEID